MDIFGTNDFMCRSECGEWTSLWQTLYMTANVGIVWLFLLIGVTVAYLGREFKKRGLSILIDLRAAEKARRLGAVVCAVFVLCAGGHLFENLGAFWWPAYRFFALWHLATLVVTAFAAVKLANFGLRVVRMETTARRKDRDANG